MSLETPARIAILGAGPIGLEAALYARYLGYQVDLYERGRVAENVLRWGHVTMFSPWRMNRSTLGVAALEAQDAAWRAPADEACLTGRQWAEAYLLPLARCDLLADCIHEQCEVLAIGRPGLLKGDLAGQEQRGEGEFRLLVRERAARPHPSPLPEGEGVQRRLVRERAAGPHPGPLPEGEGGGDAPSGPERVATADAVIDASGTYGQPNWLGDGGIPAVGERAAAEHIEYGLADILGHQRERYAGRHVLVVGAGASAATSVVALAELARSDPSTRVTWVTRRAAGGEGPVRPFAGERLPLRDELARRANALAAEGALVRHLPGTRVDAVAGGPEGFVVRLVGEHAGELAVDRLIANVGYRPDNRLWAELQVDECYARGGPRKLAAAWLSQGFVDCLDARPCGPEALVCPEPDFYVLGAKSYGRGSQFLYSMGLEQIRALFAILHDRAELDLYASVAHLCR